MDQPKPAQPKTHSTAPQATTPPSETKPADLHIAEELPPPMPEEADKPAHANTHAPFDATAPKQADGLGDTTAQPHVTTADPPSATRPKDLQIDEQPQPSMPELADKPAAPAKKPRTS